MASLVLTAATAGGTTSITPTDQSGVVNITLPSTSGTLGLSTGSATQSFNAQNTFGFKNRIINGAMAIDQRNAGGSVTPVNGAYTLDRWLVATTIASDISVQQSTTVPSTANFKNSVLITSLAASSVVSGTITAFQQYIEGNNIYDIGWGTSNAQPISISFWVRSSLTGTFPLQIQNSAQTYSYVATYTISASNTWQYITISVPAQTSGVWATDNGVGLIMRFVLATGSTYQTSSPNTWLSGNYWGTSSTTNLIATNGATFYVTGVQFEVGTQATSFDYRSIGTELALCQRYYFKTIPVATGDSGNGFCTSTTNATVYTTLPVQMRTNPTALEQSGTATDYTVRVAGGAVVCSSVPAFQGATSQMVGSNLSTASGLTAGQGCGFRAANTNAYLAWSAEL
jgi:hypothetical protein